MTDYINLKHLTIEELIGVVSIYPWFGVARKELCVRMFQTGGKDWGISQYADAAMYMGSRRILSDLLRSANQVDYSDSDMGEVVKTAFAFVGGEVENSKEDVAKEDGVSRDKSNKLQETKKEKIQETLQEKQQEVQQEDTQGKIQETKRETVVRVVGGDYFTRGEYEDVKRGGDDVFANFKSNLGDSEQEIENSHKKAMKSKGKPSVNDFYTETLAQVYAEQGYFEEAIRIYNKLILANPEKNTYFANLIDKLEKEINN